MRELDHKAGWELKNWRFWTVVLEKTLESPLDCKDTCKSFNPKGNQSRIFTGRTDAEAKAPILWPLDAKNWLTGRPWCWGRLKAGEDDRGLDGWMASPTQWTWVWARSGRWWRTGKFGMLQSTGGKESDMTEGLNNNNKNNGNKNTSKSFNQSFSNIINVIIGSFNSQLKCKSIKHK